MKTLLIAILALTLGSAAHAQPHFFVNTTADTQDANPGDRICADVNGQCSLRATVTEHNALHADGAYRSANLPLGTYLLEPCEGADDDANLCGDLDIHGQFQIHASWPGTVIEASEGRAVHALSGLVHITGVVLRGTARSCEPLHGGAVYNASGARLSMDFVTIEGSTVLVGNGGGIYNAGTLSVEVSVIKNNTADGAACGESGNNGGGIYNTGTILRIVNSTITGNRASSAWLSPMGGCQPGGDGSGIYNAGVIHDLTFLTITNNGTEATGPPGCYSGGGGGIASVGGTTPLTSSIVAGNYVGGDPAALSADCLGGSGTLGHNLFGAGTGCTATGSDITVDPTTVFSVVLDTLADNGGPTLTHALRAGSPAIDAGVCQSMLRYDQRIYLRDASCDIGAFEYGARPPDVSNEPLPESTRPRLEAGGPNPFRGATTIALTLAQPSTVRLAAYDARGREVAVMLSGDRAPGRHEIAFDASALPPGVYFIRAESGGGPATLALTVMR